MATPTNTPTPQDEPDDAAQTKADEAKAKLDFEHLKLSHDYAWNWLQYHAGQRMIIFRFFFIVIAILAAGYLKAIELGNTGLQAFIAATAVVLAFLFWRADIRSWDLVKIGEGHLKYSEAVLSQYLGSPSVCLAAAADHKGTRIATDYPSRRFYSLKQIIWSIYVLVGIIGVLTLCFIAHPFMVRLSHAWTTLT